MARKPPKLDTFAKQEAYKAYLAEQAALAPGQDSAGAGEEQNTSLEPGSFGDQNARANKTGGTASGFMANAFDAAALGEPGKYLQDALLVPPDKRTSAQKEALKVRRRAEELTAKRGGKVAGGIMAHLTAEEVAPSIGRREAAAATGYYDASEKTLAARGRGPDGRKLEPTAASGSQPMTSPVMTAHTGQPATVAAPSLPAGAKPAVAAAPGVQGFASRVMPDGSVRTAAGVDVAGHSNMRGFGTQAEAMAFFRPPAPPIAPVPAAAVPPSTTTGQPAQPAQPATPASPSPAKPAQQTPAAARTTSPTAKLEMAGGAPGASVAPPAPVAPVAPNNPFKTTDSAGQTIATPLPNGGGYDLMPGLEALRAKNNPFSLRNISKPTDMPTSQMPDTPDFTMGTPKPRGFQAQAEELNARPSGF